MPQTIVTIPGVGDVPFPDGTPPAVIDAKCKELYDRAQLAVRLQAPPRVDGPDPRGDAPTVMGGIFKMPGTGESLATLPIAAANFIPGLNVVDKPFTIPAAGVLGGLGEAAEQAVTDKPFSLNDIVGAAIRQAGLEATGQALAAGSRPLQWLAQPPVVRRALVPAAEAAGAGAELAGAGADIAGAGAGMVPAWARDAGANIVPAGARAGFGLAVGKKIGDTVDEPVLGGALGSLVAVSPTAAGITARAVRAAGAALPPLVRGASLAIPSIRRRVVGAPPTPEDQP